jgi:hypothetical protein
MGLSELMASVVSGIEIPTGAAFQAFFVEAEGLATEGVACDEAVAAAPRFMDAVSPTANTTMKMTNFQRICMRNLACMLCGFGSYPTR